MENEISVQQWADTWEGYYRGCIKTQDGYKRRLQELQTFDKPIPEPNFVRQWEGKIEALKRLIK